MTPTALFGRAGAALFGDQYVAPLARALGVEKNTVGKWAAGKSAVPYPVLDELERLIAARQVELAHALVALQESRTPPPNDK